MYVTDIASDNCDNGKRFWSFVRASKAKPNATSFKINESCVRDPAIIADSFNNFFASNFTDSSNPELLDTWCQGHHGFPFLSQANTSSYEIFKIIRSLKNGKAPGPDGITSTMLKHTAAQVAFPLSLIFNISLDEGKIPDDWKKANVVPIH